MTAPPLIPDFLIQKFIARKARWIEEKFEYFKKHPPGPKLKGKRGEYLKYKEEARRLATERLAYFGALYGIQHGRISIRNSKTRWGSCSKKGNLNFSYKIALLSENLRDYVIVHELCHVAEFNHSPRFWALVSKAIPNHKELRKKLRDPQVV